MSRIEEITRRLERTAEAVDALDASLAAGQIGRDEHRRRQVASERESGRLFVSLRRAQREAGDRRAGPPAASAGGRTGWLASPPLVAAVGVLLVIVGVGGGMLATRWLGPRHAPGVSALTTPGQNGLSALMGESELRALQQVTAAPDAPTPRLLQVAHAALDQGRLDEARGLYGRVLAREPRNAEAITHLGAVLYQEGRVDEALAKVGEALRIDPAYIHAHWDRTQYLYHGKRDFAGAIKAAEAFLQVLPSGPDAESVRRLIGEARAQGVKPARLSGAGG